MKRVNVDVIIFVEHVDRELDIVKLLSDELNARGLSTIIVSSIFHLLDALIFIKPRAIVTSSAGFSDGSPSLNYYNLYKNLKFYNLNFEQFISNWKGDYKKSNNPIMQNEQIHFVWGEYFQNILKNQGVNSKHIIITGRPHDVVNQSIYSKNKSLRRNKIFNEFNLTKDTSLLFIALTDGLMLVNQKHINSMVDTGAIEELLMQHIDYVKKNIKLLIADIKRFINKGLLIRENITIIIRPHPSVSIDVYKDLIFGNNQQENNNIIITKKHNAQLWLSISDLYITNYSTLCIDAQQLKIPTYTYERYRKEKIEEWWYLTPLPKITSYESFHAVAENINDLQPITDQIPYGQYVSKNINAIDVISQKIEHDLNTDKNRVTFDIKIPYFFKQAFRRVVGSYIRKVLSQLGFLWVKPGLVPDYFTLDEMNKKIINKEDN